MRDYFLQSSPGRQIGITVFAVLLLAGLIFAGWFTLVRTDYRPAFSGLQATDAATIVAELEKRKIAYKIADNGTVILVPADRADAIRLDIMSTDLPLKGTVGFELFNKSDMGLTDFAQKINYQRALQGELSRTILAMDGVEAVRVHLALGEERIFRDDRVPPKASVVVRMKNEGMISSSVADGIQRLVAAAVDKLEPANVVILDEAGMVASVVSPAPASEAAGSPAVQEKQAVEHYYQARIQTAIANAYPNVEIGVTVWADAGNAVLAEGTDRFAGWSPENRSFRLHVILSPAGDMAPGALQDMRTLAASAIALNAANGDQINVGPAPAATPSTAPPPHARTAPSAPRLGEEGEPAKGPSWISYLLVLIVIGMLGLVFVMSRQRSEKRGPRAREAFAERLNQLLREEEDRGAHSRV